MEVGLKRTDELKDEILIEILDHLGIIYKEADYGHFLCGIASTGKETRSPATVENLTVADEIAPLDELSHLLAGIGPSEDSDELDLTINEYESRILLALTKVYHEAAAPVVRKWYWPDFNKACCILTHDVDWLTYSPFHKLVMRKKPLWKILELGAGYFLGEREYGYNITEILEVEKARNLKSTFFFQTDYGRMKDKAKEAMESVRKTGSEIGLHGHGQSHIEKESLQIQQCRLEEMLGSRPLGIRHHRLKFRPDLTWRIETEAGFRYDATLSQNKNFGFKSRICYPFHPIDISRKRRIGILELPTAFMDWTALHRQYSRDDCTKMLTKIMDLVEKYNGCFAANFHNTYMNKETFPEIYETYLALLGELLHRRYWITTGIECYNWWELRNGTRLNLNLEDEVLTGDSKGSIPLVLDKADGKRVFRPVHGPFSIDLRDPR